MRKSGVLFYHPLPYFLEIKFLTAPGASLGLSFTPQKCSDKVLGIQIQVPMLM